MLELRPSCEHCGADLPPDSGGAYICSYECTFCERCAGEVLSFVCPNCTGALLPRPPRPTGQLVASPPSSVRVEKPARLDAHPAKVESRHLAAGRPMHLWEIVVDCADPRRLAGFYAALTRCDAKEYDDSWWWVELRPRGAGTRAGAEVSQFGPRLAFQQVPEPKAGKVRIHIDLGTWDIPGDVERVVALGGSVVRRPGSTPTSYVVCADPEGHEFCLVDADE